MGKQSARIRLNGKDHKEIRINGKYHKLADRDSNVLWEKIAEEPIVYEGFKIRSTGFIRFHIQGNGVIDWGDGSTETFDYSELTTVQHPSSKSLNILIKGNVIDLDFSSGTNSGRTTAYGLGAVLNELPPTMSWKTDFSYMFYNNQGASYITINSDLFKYCVNAENFYMCFCDTSLYEIPKGLFDYCKNAKTFEMCFRNAATYVGYADISNLFQCNTLAENFEMCFYNYNDYVLILGENTFKNCFSAKSIAGCFSHANITSIPEGFFDDMTNLENTYKAFMWCDQLKTVPYTLFDNCNKLKKVSQTFYGDKGITSKVPPLWEREWESEESYIGCYYNCINADMTGLTDGMWIADVS